MVRENNNASAVRDLGSPDDRKADGGKLRLWGENLAGNVAGRINPLVSLEKCKACKGLVLLLGRNGSIRRAVNGIGLRGCRPGGP